MSPFVQLAADVLKTALPLLCTSSALGSSGGRSLAQHEEKAAVCGVRYRIQILFHRLSLI